MFLARIVGSGKAQVYQLTGEIFFPRAWMFASFGRGACAIDDTEVRAIAAARRKLLTSKGVSVGSFYP